MATYTGTNLNEWYIQGADMSGKIIGENKYYYYKDHLGSVRVVTDQNFSLTYSQDGACPRMLLAGDAWGYLLEDRTYESGEDEA